MWNLVSKFGGNLLKFLEVPIAPGTDADRWQAYCKSDGLYVKSPAGTEAGPLGAGGSGGGKVLQVVSTTKTDTFTTTSTSWTDITGLSQAITPSATTSKILVHYKVSLIGTTGTYMASVQLLRGATAIDVGAAASSRSPATLSGNNNQDVYCLQTGAGQYLDSPATTSATTYKFQGKVQSGGTLYINREQSDSDSANVVRLTSSITLIEIDEA